MAILTEIFTTKAPVSFISDISEGSKCIIYPLDEQIGLYGELTYIKKVALRDTLTLLSGITVVAFGVQHVGILGSNVKLSQVQYQSTMNSLFNGNSVVYPKGYINYYTFKDIVEFNFGY